MPVIHEAKLKALLMDWLHQANPNIKAGELNGGTAILKEGLLNSVQLLDLILYIERLSENPISVDSLNPRSFQSVDAIYEHFFKGKEHELRQP
jgi:hypothetical protein